ncbi:MAG: HAD family hydrolase [Phycisphaerae bacterium]
MKFIVEWDGVIADVAPVWYEAHRRVAAEVGWSKLDQATFWRLTRTKGAEANILPGAKPMKIKNYHELFHSQIETDELIALAQAHECIREPLRRLVHKGDCLCVTAGLNGAARSAWLAEASVSDSAIAMGRLSREPGERIQDLRNLAGSDRRTVVVAATDQVVRAGRSAELLTVGISSGPCSQKRLHQAGADLVYASLADLAACVASGGKDLLDAGLLPEPAS